jgi:predicted RNA-binding protein YlxR (DUF448 family)
MGAGPELSEDAERGKLLPVRTCVVTRAAHPPDELIRFVLDPDGRVVPDLANRLPGRGAWVVCNHHAVAAAVRSKAFARSLRRPATAAADLPDVVERLMLRRALDALSLAKKAGLAVTGFGRVEGAIVAGEAAILVHGADAADDGVERLDRKFKAVSRGLGRPAPIVRQLTIEQLSLAMGRSNVVHAALSRSGIATSFLKEATRLARYRTGQSGSERGVQYAECHRASGETGKV